MNTKDSYSWLVTYTDGTQIFEYDEERPDGRGFAEREEKPVHTLTLMATDRPWQHMFVPKGAEPVFFRRRYIDVSPTEEEVAASQQGIFTEAIFARINAAPRTTVHCIGWKQGEQAEYLFVFADGSTLLSDDLQAV